MVVLPTIVSLSGALNACTGPAEPKVRREKPDLNLGGLAYGRYRLPFLPSYAIHYITLILLTVPLYGRALPQAINIASLCLAVAIYCTKMPLAMTASGSTVKNYNPREPLTYLEFDGQSSRRFPNPLTTDLLSWGLVDYLCVIMVVLVEALALSIPFYDVTGYFLLSVLVVALLAREIVWLIRVSTFSAPLLEPVRDNDHIRHMFRKHLAVGARYPEVKPKEGHSHPLSAAERNAASMSMDAFITKCGKRPYVYQASARDIKSKAYDYSLTHKPTMPKTRLETEHSDPLRDNSIIKMVDVDYFCDMYMMLWMRIPIVMYTLQPQSPAGGSKDLTWTVDTDNTFICHVNGGGLYRNQVWDYEPDELCATYHGVTHYYSVERLKISASHSFVLLAPRYSTYTGLPDGMTLHNLRPVSNTITISALKSAIPPHMLLSRPVASMVIKSDKWENLALCAPLSTYSAVIPMAVANSIQAAHSREPMTRHVLNGLLKGQLMDETGKELRKDANQIIVVVEQCLAADHSALHHAPKVSHSVATMEANYHKQQKTGSGAPKLGGRVITKPVVDDAMTPCKSRENEEWSIEARINEPSNSAQFPSEWNCYLNQFLDRAAPVQLVPLTFQQLYDVQTKPSQRINNDYAGRMYGLPDIEIKLDSFQKAEIQKDAKAPRNITTLPPETHYEYGTYTHAVAAHMKSWPCYAFGKTPQEVGAAVSAAASLSTTLTETDFTTFDGSHSDHMTWFELAFLLRCFNAYSDVLVKLFNRLRYAGAKTTSGIEYAKGGTRLSGSDDTSIFNTLINMLVTFITLCLMGFNADQAWSTIQLKGVYGGDDGIMGDLDITIYARVAKRMGLILKANRRPAWDPAGFLGRIYPYPQTCSESVADIVRQARKLHLTSDKLYPDKVVLYNKAIGIMSTDSETPVLSDWAKAVIRLVGEQRVVRALQPYTLMEGAYSDKMSDTSRLEEAARQCDLSIQLITAFSAACSAATSLDEIPTLRPKKTAILPDEVVAAGIVSVPITTDVKVKRPGGWRPLSLKKQAALDALNAVATPPKAGPDSLPGAETSAEADRGDTKRVTVKSKKPTIISGAVVDNRRDKSKPIKFEELVSDNDIAEAKNRWRQENRKTILAKTAKGLPIPEPPSVEFKNPRWMRANGEWTTEPKPAGKMKLIASTVELPEAAGLVPDKFSITKRTTETASKKSAIHGRPPDNPKTKPVKFTLLKDDEVEDDTGHVWRVLGEPGAVRWRRMDGVWTNAKRVPLENKTE